MGTPVAKEKREERKRTACVYGKIAVNSGRKNQCPRNIPGLVRWNWLRRRGGEGKRGKLLGLRRRKHGRKKEKIAFEIQPTGTVRGKLSSSSGKMGGRTAGEWTTDCKRDAGQLLVATHNVRGGGKSGRTAEKAARTRKSKKNERRKCL